MARNLFSDADRAQIVKAIAGAEKRTSGEIQVHLEKRCKGSQLDRAVQVFNKLKMHETKGRTGILFYLAVTDQKFAVIGDTGINEKVPEGFWDAIKDHMLELFRQGQFTKGLVEGITMAGEQLAVHFPDTKGENELSDEISFGND